MRIALPILVLALPIGCRERVSFDEPIPDDGTFQRAEATGETLRRYQLAADWSVEHDGLAVVVIEGDHIVFEDYAPGYSLEQPVHIFSGTKSFACALAVAAQADGLLDLDAPAADQIQPWATAGAPYTSITGRHLLDLTSGLADDYMRLTHDGFMVNQQVEDKYAHALQLDLETSPGAVFSYGSAHLMAFGAQVTALVGGSPLDYLHEKVLDPIGLRYAGWIHDPAGNPMFAYGAWTTALEWAKYGVLLRDDGTWQGERLLPEGDLASCREGSRPMPAYGLTFWLNAHLTEEQAEALPSSALAASGGLYPGGPADIAAAAGYDDQRLYVIPSLDLVVVRLGEHHRKWSDTGFLARLLDGDEGA